MSCVLRVRLKAISKYYRNNLSFHFQIVFLCKTVFHPLIVVIDPFAVSGLRDIRVLDCIHFSVGSQWCLLLASSILYRDECCDEMSAFRLRAELIQPLFISMRLWK